MLEGSGSHKPKTIPIASSSVRYVEDYGVLFWWLI